VVCDADSGWTLLFDPQNEKSYKVAKEGEREGERATIDSPGRDT
jgi:hypothetical protein